MEKRKIKIFPEKGNKLSFDIGYQGETGVTELLFLGLNDKADIFLLWDTHKENECAPVPVPSNRVFEIDSTYTIEAGAFECQLMEKVDGQYIALYDPFILKVKPSKTPVGKIEKVPVQFQTEYNKMVSVRQDTEAKLADGSFVGPVGPSNYEIAVKNGFKGSEAEWLEELKYRNSKEFQQLAKAVNDDKVAADKSALAAKTSETNAAEAEKRIAGKETSFDADVLKKTETFDANALAKTKAFDANAATKKKEVDDASALFKTDYDLKTKSFNEKVTTANTGIDQKVTSAQTSETKAKASENNAKKSETNAKIYADKCVDKVSLPVEKGQPIFGTAGDYALSDGKGGIVFVARKDLTNWAEIQGLVRAGIADKIYPVGSSFNVPYTLGGKKHQVPFHVAGYDNVVDEKGETKQAMLLQPHFLMPQDIVFDYYEAMYEAVDQELPAGTYYVTTKEKWGNYVEAGKQYTFTLTKPVPIGGQIVGFKNSAYSGIPKTIETYKDAYSTEPIESVAMTEGSAGTNLGDLTFKGNEQLNSIEKASYGYNRWSQSFVRQFLNSSGKDFYKKQAKYDRPPTNYKSIEGFMSGFDKEFLAVLGKVKVSTAQNTDTETGETDVTYDTFFLPSNEQMSITSQAKGIEGKVLDYWNEVSQGKEWPWYKDTPELVSLGVDDNRPHYYWLRSANRSNALNAWHVIPSGIVSSYSACNARRLAPLCAIF